MHPPRAAARAAGVCVVTGDTKVVPKGAADKLFINTTGIGDMTVTCGRFCLGGIGLAGLVGVLLNLILPGTNEAHEEQSGNGHTP